MRPILFLFLLLLAAQAFARGAIDSIRFDGFYCTSETPEYKEYLRFYPNGTVTSLTVDTTGEPPPPREIASWLDDKDPGISKGKFAVDSKSITIVFHLAQGTISYRGKIQGKKLELYWRSSISHNEGTDHYRFVVVASDDSGEL